MIRRPCSGPFKYKFIAYNGDVTVCCLDTEKELVIGNINENSLDEIWDNEKAHKIRLAHITGNLEEYPVCARCPNLDAPTISDDEVKEYLKSIKREDLIKVYEHRIKGDWDRNFENKRVLIELTDHCNLNCIMCANRKAPHGIPMGFMDFKLYKKILDEVDLSKAWSLELFWLGESLLHPKFDDIMEYTLRALEGTKSHINLHTNGIFVDEKKAMLFFKFKEKFPWITFSIDALKQKTYSKIRRGGNVELVNKNLKNFILLRKKHNFQYPNINIQFILMEENAHELKEFVDYWMKFYRDNKIVSNDVLYIKRVEVHDIKKQEKANKLFDEIIKKHNLYTNYNNQLSIRSEDKPKEGVYWFEQPKRRVCAAPFKNPVIRWDGEVTVCCLDDIFLYSMGNLKEKSFDEIWYGKKMDDFRRKHIEGRYDELVAKDGSLKCKNCIGYFWPIITDEEIEEYKKDKGI